MTAPSVWVIRIAGQRPGMQHELTTRCPRIGGDDGSLHTELVRGAGLALADALHLRSVEPRAEQITRSCRLVFPRPHRSLRLRRPNHASRFEGIAKTKLQVSRAADPETLQSQLAKTARKRLSLSGLELLHGRLLIELMRGTASLESRT